MPAPPTDRDELLAWARAEGVEALLKSPVPALAPRLDPGLSAALAPYGGALTLADAAVCDRWTRGVLAGLGDAGLDAVQQAALAHLEDAARTHRAGLARERELLDAPAPDDPTLAALHAGLLALRARLRDRHRPAAGPTPPARFDAADLVLEAGPARIDPSIASGADALGPNTAALRCTATGPDCDAGACAHALHAVDAALGWLLDLGGTSEAGAVIEALRAPAWTRLFRSLEEDAPAPPPPADPLAWHLFGLGAALELAPRRGGVPVDLHALETEAADGALRRPADRRVVERLAAGAHPSRARDALLHLVGHPRVFVDGAPVEVVEGRLALVAESRPGGALALVPSVDGRSMELADLLSRLGEPGGREVLVDLDTAARRLTVVRIDAAARRIVALLWRHGALFPTESHDALLARVPALQEALPVILPDTLMGEEMVADPRPVLRFDPILEEVAGEEASAGGAAHATGPVAGDEEAIAGLTLTVFVRPVPGGPTFPPGVGAPVACGNAAGTRVHARRDLDEERARTRTLLAGLPLPEHAADGPFRFVLEGDDALDLLAFLERVPAADAPIVEWPRALRPWRIREPGALSLKVAGGGQDWFRFRATFDLDGEAMHLALLLDALRRGARYVPVGGGQWVAITETLRARLGGAADLFEPEADGTLSLGAEAAAALDLLDEVTDEATCEAWSTLKARLAAARRTEPPLPEGLRATLRPYQREGFQWMARLAAWTGGGCLADDMGLGKTVQTIALLLHRAAEGPALVVAPTSVCPGWIAELARFAPSLKVRAHGGPRRRLGRPKAGEVVVTSWGVLTRDADALSKVRLSTLVLDEAQAIKNPVTRRARAARAVSADFRLALSGTPVENHLDELWSLFSVVLPGLLGSAASFKRRFAVPIEREGDRARREALGRLVRPFLLRRTKREVVHDLPPRVDLLVGVDLSAEERRLYEEARLAAVAKLTGLSSTATAEQRRFEVLAAITRLRLLACHPRLFDPRSTLPSAKLDRLLGIVGDLCAAGHRALVFSQFTRHLGLVREALDARGVSYLYLDGATPAGRRGDLVSRFQEGEGDLFLVSLKAGGTGLNLTAADHVIHLDPWWNPALEDQATDRAHRIGQKRSVTVMRLVARGTIEEAILDLHAHKRALLEAILDGADRSASLSEEELEGLLAEGEAAFSPEPDEEEIDAAPVALAPEDDAALEAEIAAFARGRSAGR